MKNLNEKHSFKPHNRLDISEPPYRKEDLGFEKVNSRRIKKTFL